MPGALTPCSRPAIYRPIGTLVQHGSRVIVNLAATPDCGYCLLQRDKCGFLPPGSMPIRKAINAATGRGYSRPRCSGGHFVEIA
jgi:hypothetical protein